MKTTPSTRGRKNLEKIRRSCEIISEVLKIVVADLRVGKTETEVAREIRTLAKKMGASKLSFPSIVSFDENSSGIHHRPTKRKLRRGDVVMIDCGLVVDGWCSDITRTFFTAEPTAEQRRVYNLVLQAKKSAEKISAVGVRTKTVDAAAREKIVAAGFSLPHAVGHGVGRVVHELPRVSPKSREILRDGDVFTIEPGIYLPENFGVRIEDTFAIVDGKIETLTKFPTSLAAAKLSA